MCDCHDPALRQERDDITGLPLGGDGEEFLAVDSPSGCATVYVSVPNVGPGERGDVRVNLYAGLMGVRELVASAIVPAGYRGACIEATGIQVDGWHVTFQASSPTVRLRAGIQAGRGCSGYAIHVPQRLQTPPSTDTPAELYRRNLAPNGREDGLPSVYTEAGGNPTLRDGERVLAIMGKAAAPSGTIDLSGLPLETAQLITVAGGDAYNLNPGGSIAGPGPIVFANFVTFTVYTVR